MRDWRPDLRVAERYVEPYERQVAKDLVKVEKLRQRAVKQHQTSDEKAVGRIGLAAYFTLIAVVIAVLVVSFDAMKVRTDHRQKELAMRTCQMFNRQHMREATNMVYAYQAARAAHMDKQASHYLILAKESRKSMSDCRR